MSRNEILYYNEYLKNRARELRNNPTCGEKVLWEYLRKKQVDGFEFHRQVPIDHFIVDFYCHELKLALEIDGTSHNDKMEYDDERQGILESAGITFLRFTETQACSQPERIIKNIKQWIHEAKDRV